MHRILLSASFAPELMLRQTPGCQGIWNDVQFVPCSASIQESEMFDGWVVYDDIRAPLQANCPSANTLLITGEPESLRRYRSRYTGQFAHVWTSHRSIQHSHLQRRNEGQHWHYGLRESAVHGASLGFDELEQLPCPQKTKLASVICSNKVHTEDHRKRLEFVQALQRHFGDQVDVFGRGIREMSDKADAIYDYRYHIVLENDHSELFMTEKLADAFLGWSYPIYFGGTEAYHRYPEGSFTAIDIYKPNEAINIIDNLLRSDAYQLSLPRIAEARSKVLFENNICHMMSEFCQSQFADAPASTIRMFPKNHRASLVYQQFKRVLQQPFKRNRAA